MAEEKKAYFAGGCFWCVEEAFEKTTGVIKAISGYTGGHVKNPTYEQVTYKETGHFEAVEVSYDPSKVSYEDLLKIFWRNIDPFDAEGQFCDKGSSYLSAVFYQNDQEKKAFEKSKDEECHLCGFALSFSASMISFILAYGINPTKTGRCYE